MLDGDGRGWTIFTKQRGVDSAHMVRAFQSRRHIEMTEPFAYDVAFSFLAGDEPVGR